MNKLIIILRSDIGIGTPKIIALLFIISIMCDDHIGERKKPDRITYFLTTVVVVVVVVSTGTAT